MNSRPVPEELFVDRCGGRIIRIIANSVESEKWIQDEAPLFGDLQQHRMTGYLLFVNDSFDLQKVIDYLRSYSK